MHILYINKKTTHGQSQSVGGPLAGTQKSMTLAKLKKRRAPLNFAAADPTATGAGESPNEKSCIDDTRSIAASLWGVDALALE